MKTNYNIKKDENGKQICKFYFEWVDSNGEKQIINTDSIDIALVTIELLNGDISLGDLEN